VRTRDNPPETSHLLLKTHFLTSLLLKYLAHPLLGSGVRGSVVVEALSYKPEGRGVKSR
jgi:hypothetical protein